MNRKLNFLLKPFAVCCALGAVASAASAQDISQSVTRTTRAFTVGAPDRTGPSFRAEAAAEERLQNDLTFGVGYQRNDGDGHAVSIPVQYGRTTLDGLWQFRAETGLARLSAGDGSNASGLTDLTLVATRRLAASTPGGSVAWQVLGGAALGIPSHGDVGSTHYSQQARLIGIAGASPWTGVAAGVLVHFNGQAPGLSSVLKVLHGEVLYDLSDRDTLIAKLDRTYLRGAGGSTSVTFEYDRTFTKRWTGNFYITRGLTEGARSTAAEVDLVYRF